MTKLNKELLASESVGESLLLMAAKFNQELTKAPD